MNQAANAKCTNTHTHPPKQKQKKNSHISNENKIRKNYAYTQTYKCGGSSLSLLILLSLVPFSSIIFRIFFSCACSYYVLAFKARFSNGNG